MSDPTREEECKKPQHMSRRIATNPWSQWSTTLALDCQSTSSDDREGNPKRSQLGGRTRNISSWLNNGQEVEHSATAQDIWMYTHEHASKCISSYTNPGTDRCTNDRRRRGKKNKRPKDSQQAEGMRLRGQVQKEEIRIRSWRGMQSPPGIDRAA